MGIAVRHQDAHLICNNIQCRKEAKLELNIKMFLDDQTPEACGQLSVHWRHNWLHRDFMPWKLCIYRKKKRSSYKPDDLSIQVHKETCKETIFRDSSVSSVQFI
jgi:hypothetical protein